MLLGAEGAAPVEAASFGADVLAAPFEIPPPADGNIDHFTCHSGPRILRDLLTMAVAPALPDFTARPPGEQRKLIEALTSGSKYLD